VSEVDEVDEAQREVGRALDVARAGDDRELAGKVRELGEQFVRMLTGAMRMTRFHDTRNMAFEAPLRDLERSLAALRDLLGMVQIIMVEDQVYVNDQRLRLDDRVEADDNFSALWLRHDVGGLNLHASLTMEQWRRVVVAAMVEYPGAQPRAALQAALEAAGLSALELLPVFRFRMKDEVRRIDQDVGAVMHRAAGVVDGLWAGLAAGRAANPLPVRKMINELVDLPAQSEEESIARSRLDKNTHALSRHSSQVAMLAVLIGRELGLPDTTLADLGVTACYHDLGYATDEDGYAPPFSRHGTAAVRNLLVQRGFHEARIHRMLACLEHHRRFDTPGGASLFARIIHIADDFETLTRYRAGGPLMSPPTALARMYAARGTEYDPELLQLFINRVGRYPPGSVLELEDGRWVLVLSGVRSLELFDLPFTEVLRLADGTEPLFPITVDLADEGAVRRVVE
jgi:HD-GYP domain-containing protein (c-di-GMP phosphodiesterase class II)